MAKKNKNGGAYVAFDNGRVGRTNGVYGPYVSMDTTGYSSGKKEFELKSSYAGGATSTKKVDKKDVPNVIKAMKSGATKTINQKPKSAIKEGAKKAIPQTPKKKQ